MLIVESLRISCPRILPHLMPHSAICKRQALLFFKSHLQILNKEMPVISHPFPTDAYKLGQREVLAGRGEGMGYFQPSLSVLGSLSHGVHVCCGPSSHQATQPWPWYLLDSPGSSPLVPPALAVTNLCLSISWLFSCSIYL